MRNLLFFVAIILLTLSPLLLLEPANCKTESCHYATRD